MEDRSVPEDVMPYIFTGIGHVVVTWTFLENALDAWTAIVFHDFGGSAVEKEIPRQFNRKIAFLRKCLGRLPGLAPYKDAALAMMDEASRLSKVRHAVTHGTLSHFDPVTETFWFTRVDVYQDKSHHVFEDVQITGNALTKAGTDLAELARNCQNLAGRLAQVVVPQNKRS